MANNFITDMRKSYTLKTVNNEKIYVHRYGVWCYCNSKGKHQVFETSDDLEYLKKKYSVPSDSVHTLNNH